ncbi:hypothetical protein [Microbacterium caowuchunii]|uniref:Lipoprotein n=1 Tax=Microbacterium caowuchunii TaxID=2614638 RepID=A0A5N0TKK5_9MICO|nr:hypothetical protein [Microbacterium caowuchunii]KAA9135620.1 hypothetical protein F6B40_02180 [Microbacterium caowuchunii]
MSGGGRAAGVAVGLALLLTLSGCAAPDPEVIALEAQEVFDELVAAAAATDTAVLRTLETAPPRQERCPGEEDHSQTALTASGVVSITADEGEAGRIRDDLAASLDPEEWTTIIPAVAEQRAWISDHDVVVTLSADGPALVIAVFTPCSASSASRAFASPVGMPYTG